VARIVLEAATEAHLRPACDLLAAHDIPFRVNGAALSSLRGALPFTTTPVSIEVLRDEDVERARALIEAHDHPEDEDLLWRCTGCGEESPGNFDTCWKCRRARPAAALLAASSPYRGDRPNPAAASEAPPAPPKSRGAHLRDLAWAAGVGLVPGAAAMFALTRWIVAPSWSLAQKYGCLNIVVGLELALALRWARRRDPTLGPLWGDREHRLTDVVLGVLFAGVLYGVNRAVLHHLGHFIAAYVPSATTTIRRHLGHGPDIGLAFVGIGLAGWAGAWWFYGVIQRSLEGVLRSRVGAVLITSLLGSLFWSTGSDLTAGAQGFAGQLLLCGAYVVGGRIRPLAVAAIGSALLRWIVSLTS
jgi:putative signal transducing protein